MTTTRYPVIAVLKVRMRNSGVTQRELSDRTGIHQSSISDILSGVNSNPTLATLEKLSEALGLGVAIVDERGIPVTPKPEPCPLPHVDSPIPDNFVIRVTHSQGKRTISIEEA